MAADVMQRADVRVVQAGDGLRLALEPLLQIGVGGDVLRQDFDGDGAIQSRIPRPVHLSHAPGSDRSEDFIRAEPGAFNQSHLVRLSVLMPLSPILAVTW